LVKLSLCTGDRVEATVLGTVKHQVVLDRDRNWVWATCTCPDFSDRDEICGHIWATVVAADPKRGLRGPRGGLPNLIASSSSDWDDDLDDWEDDEDVQYAQPLPPPAAKPAPRPPDWRQTLAPLATPPVLPEAFSGEILWVIDLPGTLHRQALALELLTFRRTKDGSRGVLKPPRGVLKPLRIRRSQIPTLRDPLDRELLYLLAGATSGDLWMFHSVEYLEIPSRLVVPDELAPEVARRLCATGRCHLRSMPQQIGEKPLRFDDGPPWELWLAVREEEKDGSCELVPELRLAEKRRTDARTINLLPRAGLLFTLDVLARIDTGKAWRWLPYLCQPVPFRVPAADREDFLATLLTAADLPHLDLPPALRVEEVEAKPGPRLRLLPPSGWFSTYRDWPEGKVSYLYEDCEVDAGSPARGIYLKEGRRFLRRDRAMEDAALERLAALGFRQETARAGEQVQRIAPARVPETVRALLADGWTVEAQGKIYRSASRFKMSVASGIDWFELHGDAEFAGETVGLPQLLAA